MNIAKALGQFLAELRQTNRKLDQIIDLLKIQAEMRTGEGETGHTYTVTVPSETWSTTEWGGERVKLTKGEILNASPEQLREWVAVHVMGWKKQYSPDSSIWAWEYPSGTTVTAEAWSEKLVGNWVEDMNHAWEVVEKIVDTTIEEANCAPSTRFMVLWRHANLCASSASEAAWSICYMALMAKVGEP